MIESRLSGDQRVRSGPGDLLDRAGEDEGWVTYLKKERRRVKLTSKIYLSRASLPKGDLAGF